MLSDTLNHPSLTLQVPSLCHFCHETRVKPQAAFNGEMADTVGGLEMFNGAVRNKWSQYCHMCMSGFISVHEIYLKHAFVTHPQAAAGKQAMEV